MNSPIEIGRFVVAHVDAVDVALAQAAQVQRALAQRLRRQRAGVSRTPRDDRLFLDDRDTLAEIRGLGCAFLARRARTDHHQS